MRLRLLALGLWILATLPAFYLLKLIFRDISHLRFAEWYKIVLPLLLVLTILSVNTVLGVLALPGKTPKCASRLRGNVKSIEIVDNEFNFRVASVWKTSVIFGGLAAIYIVYGGIGRDWSILKATSFPIVMGASFLCLYQFGRGMPWWIDLDEDGSIRYVSLFTKITVVRAEMTKVRIGKFLVFCVVTFYGHNNCVVRRRFFAVRGADFDHLLCSRNNHSNSSWTTLELHRHSGLSG